MAGKKGFDPLTDTGESETPDDSDEGGSSIDAAVDGGATTKSSATGLGADPSSAEPTDAEPEEPAEGTVSGAIETALTEGADDVLLLGPMEWPRGHKTCTHFFGTGSLAERNVLFVSLTRSADDCLALLRDREGFPANVGVVTASDQFSSATTKAGDGSGGVTVKTVSDPSDLPKLGVTISRLVSDWEGDGRETIVCFHSLSALLQYADLQRVFRFLHILKDRVASVDATTHYHMDSEAHDRQSVATLRQLFDAVIEYDEGGEARIR